MLYNKPDLFQSDKMKRSIYFTCLLLLTIIHVQAREKPNVILIMLDDSGWTDFGCYGSQIETPNIDQFAKEGMRFTDCHSAAPNCSPSRAGILTGRTPSRVGMYSYRPHHNVHAMHLRDEEITIAEVLKEKGYKTGHFGKWHLSELGNSSQPGPADQGFDYSLGTENNAIPSHLNPNNFVRNGKALGVMKGYSCQIVVDETINWLNSIETHQNPFFACVWYHEPHAKIASPPELIEKYKRKYPGISEKDATYYANIENVDIATGRLLDHLEKMGVKENTFVMLTSDNGGLNAFSNQGLRGKKSNVWEGGHREPGIFRWPGKIPANLVCDVPISGVDFFPTVCEITNADVPKNLKIDGTSIARLLSGEEENIKRRTPLYWFFYRMNPSLALREDQWVLIAESTDSQRPKTHPLVTDDMPFIKASEPVYFELYDLSVELSQKTNVAKEYPGVLKRLKKKMLKMHRDVLSESPVWEIEDDDVDRPKKLWK